MPKPQSQIRNDRERDEQVLAVLRRRGPSRIEDLQGVLYLASREHWRLRLRHMAKRGLVRKAGDCYEVADADAAATPGT